MAKVVAPLLAMSASGQIGKSMVFGDWRGIKYARQYVVPANPNSAAQQTSRTTFATLREMWKLLPTLGRAPWDAFATGRPFLGLNSFIGENQRVVRGDANFQDFIGSPGARGGIPPTSVVVATGVATGEIDVQFTNPTPPTGWTLDATVAVGFPDQDPAVVFGGPLVTGEDAATQGDVTLAGFGSATLTVAAGFLRWTKPDGATAYSVGITGNATAGV